MTKNPIVNALGASGYIFLVVSLMNFLEKNLGNKPDTFFAPMVFLSLLTLSVTVMAFIFFYQPVQLYMDGKKKQAANLFIKTLGIFAVITTAALVLLISGLI